MASLENVSMFLIKLDGSNGMASGKYNPLSGACPFIVACLKLTNGELSFVLKYCMFVFIIKWVAFPGSKY
jgi:hypothetical protein